MSTGTRGVLPFSQAVQRLHPTRYSGGGVILDSEDDDIGQRS